MPVNISHTIIGNNPYISFTVYPFAQLLNGRNGGLSFDRNYAGGFGGGMSIDSSVNNLFMMPGGSFTRNLATSGGGAVYVNDSNSGLYFYSTTFSRNRLLTE